LPPYTVDQLKTGIREFMVEAARVGITTVHDPLLLLPDSDGMDIIRIVKERKPETEVVVITGYSSVTSAVDAMKIGVADYLAKPFTENEIKIAIENALRKEKPATAEKAAADDEKSADNLIQKREVLRVLDRTNRDVRFSENLLEGDCSVLKAYDLTSEARAAIASGDLKWLRKHVGELTEEQMIFVNKRLEKEAW
jgi:ActR/RegA family two-component response regulator